MSLIKVQSYAYGDWIDPSGSARTIASAIDGSELAIAGSDSLQFQDMIHYAKEHGGPALRRQSFHDRARMIKALALHLREHRDALYTLSYNTGATLSDSQIDIDGGIGTLLVFASKGRREMPDDTIYLDGDVEMLSRQGTFLGQHVCTSLRGVAVHINAYNFPVWGMLEKLGPCLLAGVPAIIKPATSTGYVAEAAFKILIDSGLLPTGAIQLVSGGTGDLLDHLGSQDVVSFTGSASTALSLRSKPTILSRAVRFVAEQDSLNASVLGPDAIPGTPEFDLFIRESVRELSAKAGQKCTAIRRIMAPEQHTSAVIQALSSALDKIVIGHPANKSTQMGALVSHSQRQDVLNKVESLSNECDRVYGDPDNFTVVDADAKKGAFLPPMILHCQDPTNAIAVHHTEAFGPVATVMPYRDNEHAMTLLNKADGSLVASIITHDADIAREYVIGSAAFHGRLYFNDRTSMDESTGHGSPLPHMVHGGPGRAGGGEELGGIRGVMHYMQRTAIQGSPDILTRIGKQWVPGSNTNTQPSHPFTRNFHDLNIGESIQTAYRTITLDDIEHFAKFTGDEFYAHMDEEAAAASPFFPGRVAHGYLLLSFAAGLFVEPSPGPVLANTGLNNLTFQKPVVPGDRIRVQLIVRRKTPRTSEYGEVRWYVELTNQDDEQVANYELLTMNSYS
ncbi:phenylacetic acid degradation bifunctional protein PaaZ [Granulosicoccus sp.]|nr:phenylacetic acid degradation bifunctional protein PaaZ [Granulosicoccus sp.]MDB4224841.1 phenylacetic acid degradation bifunctional protein PaaZ [Granulosicoccus sp.]